MSACGEVTFINGKRCTGHCCRDFYLPFKPDELKDPIILARYDPVEIAFVADMVIPLPDSPKYEPESEGFRYTCRHHDSVTGNCGVYATRPQVCRDYPYGQECRYAECATHPWYLHYKVPRWITLAYRDLKLRVHNWKNQNKVKKLHLDVLAPAKESSSEAKHEGKKWCTENADSGGNSLPWDVPKEYIADQECSTQSGP